MLVAACGADNTPTPIAPTPEPTQAPELTEAPKPTEPPTTAPASPRRDISENALSSLLGTGWTLSQLNGQPVLTDTFVTLNFAAIRATGSDGCNNYTTVYAADETKIKFQTPIAATLMACAAPIMRQATEYGKALEDAATYKIDQKQLTLSDTGGKALAVFDEQSTDLAGTSWNVISYNNGKQAVVSTILSTTLTANFGADGNLSGSAGCNSYNASYETDAKSTIKIGPPITTRMACAEPAGVMEQESQYLQALTTAATYKIDGDKLEMRTADGAAAATFQKAQP
jgi:heat shock protein HslJ